MAGVKLKRLRIDKYRNVAPGTELVFNDTFNVLLGQNGTGKTTLLRLIAMVVASDFEPLKNTEFAFEYELSYPGLNVTVSIQSQQQKDAPGRPRKELMRADVSHLRGESMAWAYQVVVQLDGDDEAYTISSSPSGAWLNLKSKPGDGQPVKVIAPFGNIIFIDSFQHIINLSDDAEGQRGLLISAVENLYIPAYLNTGRFDEALDGFRAMLGLSESADDRLHRSAVNITTKPDSNTFALADSPFCPARLCSHLSELTPRRLTSESVKVTHTELDFLKKAVELFGFDSSEMILRLLTKEVKDDGELLTYGKFSFLFTLDQGSIITQEALSYGQKRLLSFLYYVAANDDIIIADELVNGMHYAWIEACLDAIGDRQSFLTSQSPLLLDFLPFTSAEEVQRSFILSSLAKREHKRQLVWKNMSEQDAQSFFRAYKTQALQVSEILRSSGLW